MKLGREFRIIPSCARVPIDERPEKGEGRKCNAGRKGSSSREIEVALLKCLSCSVAGRDAKLCGEPRNACRQAGAAQLHIVRWDRGCPGAARSNKPALLP